MNGIAPVGTLRNSETLKEGPIFDLCKAMLPKGSMDSVQINRNEACTEHTDKNIGDSYTIVFGKFEGGILEFENERPHRLKRVWRRYDASQKHWVTRIRSGIRVSLTAFRAREGGAKANVNPERNNRMGSRRLDEVLPSCLLYTSPSPRDRG